MTPTTLLLVSLAMVLSYALAIPVGVLSAWRRGRSIDEILSEMKMVAEGVKSSPSVVELAKRRGVEMPICEAVAEVCDGRLAAGDALIRLMTRSRKSERD